MTKPILLSILLVVGSTLAPPLQAQPAGPDLTVAIRTPSSTVPGGDIGRELRLEVHNGGDAVAPGSLDAAGNPRTDGYFIDLVLSTDDRVPSGFASPGPFREDVLLVGGRVSRTVDVEPGSSVEYGAGRPGVGDLGPAVLPADTPPGRYLVCAVVDPGDSVQEASETNNVACAPITVTAEIETRRSTTDFRIEQEHSVPFLLFNVITEGTVRAEVAWEGASELTVTLEGRRRPGLADPTAPYAEVAGASPLVLTYDVTTADLARGVGWRLILRDANRRFDALGTIDLTVPFDEGMDARFQQEKVSLRSGDLWPSSELQAALMTEVAASRGTGVHGIISLTGASSCCEARDLERHGLVRQSFLAGRNAYGLIRRGANPSHPDIAGLVRAITPLEAEDKIAPGVLVGDYASYQVQTALGEPDNMVLNPDGTLELSVLFARDTAQAEIAAVLGASAVSFDAITDRAWRATVDPANLRSLATHDAVEWVDVGPAPPMPDNNNLRNVLNVNPVQNVTATNAGPPPAIAYGGLTGNGIVMGIEDTGIDATHPDLNVVTTISPAVQGSHGTHVAGIAAGSGLQSSLTNALGNANGGAPFRWRGMAPVAGIVASGDLVTGGNLLSAIQTWSLDVVNRSQSISYDGNYDVENQTIDQEVRGGATSGGTAIPRRPLVLSAGNHGSIPGNQRPSGIGLPVGQNLTAAGQTGYFSITKQVKNPIVVGNWVGGAGNLLNAGSSLGPTYDGRLKPDVVAPGTNVTSTGTVGDGSCAGAGTNSSSGYTGCTGTSMASPAVAGVVALLLEAWQTDYSTPLGTTIDASPPLPSTMKAVLVQTATDAVNANVRNQASPDVDADSNPANGNDGTGQVSATAGPDYATGWGLVNAQAAVNLQGDLRLEGEVPVPNRIIQGSVQQGGTREYSFVVDQAGPVRVTLAWDDFEASPANPATAPMLVNDLDLELEAPDGTISYPWRLGHTIQDPMGNPLADNAQPAGTDIRVQVPITPVANPNFVWQVCVPGPGCGRNNVNPVGVGPNIDYVPLDAVDGDGANDTWVAQRGKDHLNNVEQVLVNVPNDPAQFGHWTLRVIGFDVPAGPQDFSVAGFPYPDLPDLVAFSADKVGIPGLGEDVTFTWSYSNVGALATPGDFEYRVLLSADFAVDAGDVVLADSAADPALASLGPLAPGASGQETTTVQIDQADVDALLGAGSTFDDLIAADVFLLVQVDSAEEVLEHNETNLTFVQLARLVDVVLVMDRSGSMSSTIPVSSGARAKLDVLKDSASLFLDLLRRGAGDRLGEVSFAGSSAIVFDDGGDLVADFSDAELPAARAGVTGLVAGGSTNIRDALQDALDMIPAGDERRKVIVFFSDGMRTAGGDPTEAAFLQGFDDESIRVFSVGFGTEGGGGNAGIDIDLLQTLSNVGDGGFFHVTERPAGLSKFFVQAVAGAIDSTVVVDPEGTIPSGGTAEVRTALGSSDRTATFILSWDDPAGELELAVRSPSGDRVTEANHAGFGGRVSLDSAPTYKLMTLELPITAGPNDSHAGEWEMEIANPGAGAVRYAASVIAQSSLRTDVAPSEPSRDATFRGGEPVGLRIGLRRPGGAPVERPSVQVVPNVPLVSLGNLLSSGLVSAADLARVPRSINGEELTLEERMVIALRDIVDGDPLPRADLPPITLRGRDGAFSGVFRDTTTPGIYGFTYRVSGIDADCEPLQREEMHTVTVGTVVDREASIVTVVGSPDGAVTVTVTPLDRGGNFLGPGHAGDLVIETANLIPVTSILDGLDGTYSQKLRTERPGRARIAVRYGGTLLERVELNTDSPRPSGVVPDRGSTVGPPVRIAVQTSGGDVGGVTGVRLSSEEKSVSLDLIGVDRRRGVVRAVVPRGLDPGVYQVALETRAGPTPVSAEATFVVVGRNRASGGLLDGVARECGDPRDLVQCRRQLEKVLVALRRTPLGPGLTPRERQAAALEVWEALARPGGLFTAADLPKTVEVLTAGGGVTP